MPASRVVSVRFTEVEYEALAGLAVLENTSVNALIRKAAGEMVRAAVKANDYEEKKAAAIQRAEAAAHALRQAVGLDESGAMPIITRDMSQGATASGR